MKQFDNQSSEFNQALSQASSELGVPDYYAPCVRPLFAMPMQQWPMCCGGRCDPCAQMLINVAVRICELLNLNPDHLPGVVFAKATIASPWPNSNSNSQPI